jgi:hypothetical protein
MKRVLVIAAVVAAGAGAVTASHATNASVPACPGHAPKLVSHGITDKRFVRPGASTMRLCRYYNINWGGHSLGLWQQRLIRGRVTIGRITHMFNGLSEAPRGILCVMDDGSEMSVEFGYPNGSSERVVVKLSGCPFTMNGRSTRWATPRLQRRLLNLVKGS